MAKLRAGATGAAQLFRARPRNAEVAAAGFAREFARLRSISRGGCRYRGTSAPFVTAFPRSGGPLRQAQGRLVAAHHWCALGAPGQARRLHGRFLGPVDQPARAGGRLRRRRACDEYPAPCVGGPFCPYEHGADGAAPSTTTRDAEVGRIGGQSSGGRLGRQTRGAPPQRGAAGEGFCGTRLRAKARRPEGRRCESGGAAIDASACPQRRCRK